MRSQEQQNWTHVYVEELDSIAEMSRDTLARFAACMLARHAVATAASGWPEGMRWPDFDRLDGEQIRAILKRADDMYLEVIRRQESYEATWINNEYLGKIATVEDALKKRQAKREAGDATVVARVEQMGRQDLTDMAWVEFREYLESGFSPSTGSDIASELLGRSERGDPEAQAFLNSIGVRLTVDTVQ